MVLTRQRESQTEVVAVLYIVVSLKHHGALISMRPSSLPRGFLSVVPILPETTMLATRAVRFLYFDLALLDVALLHERHIQIIDCSCPDMQVVAMSCRRWCGGGRWR